MIIKTAKDLDVYQLAYEQALRIFELSSTFPDEEKFALTSQIRRASRSVCLNLREAWAKRRYEAHFISKLTDCDGENGETETALDFALDCGFMRKCNHAILVEKNHLIGKKLGKMLSDPDPFIIRK